MSTPYEKIYENLLPKFRSYEIPMMTVEEVKENLHDYLFVPYQKLKGNGTAEKFMNEVQKLPLYNNKLEC